MSDGPFTIKVKAANFLARVDGAHERMREAARRVVTSLGIEVQGIVKSSKLSGAVLHNKTGTLRRSINVQMQDNDTAVLASVGTNIKYAAIHEYGFDGEESVSAHTRRSAAQMAVSRTKRARKSEGLIQVRGFTRHMHMPERSFLRSTLREQQEHIRTSINAAIMKAVRG